MSAAPDEEEEFAPPLSEEQTEEREEELARTRYLARLWVWVCPGAGYAGVGLPVLAWLSYFSFFAFTVLFAWWIYTLDAVAKWAFWGSIAIGTFLWLVEIVLVWVPTTRIPVPRFLTRLPIVALVVIWTVSFVWGGLLLVNLGSLVLSGSAMSPAANDRERFIYLKRAEDDELKHGTVILFRTSRDSGWQPNVLVCARIAAVPGDSIAMRGGRLEVNSKAGPMLGDLPLRLRAVVDVPQIPFVAFTLVPKDCYFVCSDNPSVGFDSRVLGFAERDKIVSTRVWYLRRNQFFERVE